MDTTYFIDKIPLVMVLQKRASAIHKKTATSVVIYVRVMWGQPDVEKTEMRHTPNFHAALGGSLGELFLALGTL